MCLDAINVLGFLLTKDLYSFKTIFGKNMSDDDTENYLKERKLLIDAQQQSYQQFDKAILTLSSGGLGVSIIFLRDILPIEQITNYCFLIGSWILFTISILSTLISFLTSQYAYNKQLELIDAYFLNKDSDALTKKNRFAQITEGLNVSAAVFFILAVIGTIMFVSINIT